jgi:mannose-6-phosphate isomerase-like protein (cupin superfamily)
MRIRTQGVEAEKSLCHPATIFEESSMNSTHRKFGMWGVAGLFFLVAGFAIAQSKNAGASDTDLTKAMSTRYEDVKWQTLVPELGNDSPQLSILRVDPRTGATQLLIRTPKKLHVPLHWHSANETHMMVQGTAVFEHEGKREKLGPGGFNYIPARMQHQAWGSDGALFFITVDGPWDLTWVGNPPGKSDLGQTPPE